MGTVYSCEDICNCKDGEFDQEELHNSRRKQKQTTGKKRYFTLYKNDFIEIVNPDDPNIVEIESY